MLQIRIRVRVQALGSVLQIRVRVRVRALGSVLQIRVGSGL